MINKRLAIIIPCYNEALRLKKENILPFLDADFSTSGDEFIRMYNYLLKSKKNLFLRRELSF